MNTIMRNTPRIFKLRNLGSTNAANAVNNPQIFHQIRYTSSIIIPQKGFFHTFQILKPSTTYNFECSKFRHTKAEKDLANFLADEIVAEKKAQKLKTIPAEVDGFTVSLDGANVKLVKNLPNEKVTVSFNVNHTVDTDVEPEMDPNDEKPEFGEMKSKPNFTVDVVKGSQTLGFLCSFSNETDSSNGNDSYNDCFGIDEITIYEGENNDKTYAVAGEVIDGYLYDLLMNYLEEKGISNEFGEKLIDLSTSYEHSAYIGLLEGLSEFTGRQ